MSTMKQLLAEAKELGVVGRHDLTKSDLEAKVLEFKKVSKEVDHVPPAPSRKDVRELTSHYPSLGKRDSSGRIIRAGKNLSGNMPFRQKFYYMNPKYADEAKWTEAYREAYNALPPQAKGLLNYMRDHMATTSASEIGAHIGDMAKKMGYVDSKIPGDKLFAYYRKALELLGVTHNRFFTPSEED